MLFHTWKNKGVLKPHIIFEGVDITNTNDNCYRLIQFATLNNMVIGSTMFQHKNIHKPTWTAPDRSFESQIDHVLGICRTCWTLDRIEEEMWILIII